MHFTDLNRCGYFGKGSEDLLAVGWLEPGHEFESGPVPDEFVERLHHLIQSDPWEPVSFCGGQFCGFCDSQESYSSSNLFVPYEGRVYVAPEGVLHYVVAHGYQPPKVFIEAVLSCPPFDSPSYFEGLAEGGVLDTSPRAAREQYRKALRVAQRIRDWQAAGSQGTLEID